MIQKPDFENTDYSYEPYLDEWQEEGILPQSRVDYASRGAVISNVRIENVMGQRVNSLRLNRQYRYRYDVEFTEDCHSVSFGMLIKTTSGLELAGATNEIDPNSFCFGKAGTRQEVIFLFCNRFLPSVYFMNAGVVGKIGDDRVFLHRILDAYSFRSQADPGQIGNVYLNIDASLLLPAPHETRDGV
ncbi:Wzt carbohydrate-binding domain-containing protein [Mesorhizobium sp. WSM3859]|uniref:Wzt carbohydrate-binding domain-containing protein n=1 Tax=Mesorhizobium sp. WSM3859 TaxID=2029402 RepID=UPI000BAE8024|nr:Wzt carbohydrate-binding domain-containing protein [Mesorhizobium sp. WSM3859]PBC11608.1 hypothetical protein CK230_06160 [Mesorhizobium sp. WSM3859]